MGTHPIFESDFDCLTDERDMSRKWIDATEKILLTAILLRTSAALNWPLPYLLAGTLSILNFPSLFPSEDLRYFESCRVRASSGFCVCSMVFIMFVACLVDTSTQLGWLQLGLALSSALAFTFCQIIFSALFSGLSIPLPITATMFTVPCIISAQIMAGCGAFIWDDVVQVSIFSFFCLVLTDIVQMVFPRSFTAGESFLLSALIVQGIFWIGSSSNLTKNSEGIGLIISSGLAAFLATCSIVTSAHLTRKERNSSPKLTNGDWQLALVFHCAILCCVVIVPIWSSLFEFPPPWQWLLQYLYSKCDLVHLGLLGFWSLLAYASYVLVRDHAKDNINREMTSRQRKVFHVVGVLAILSGILVDLELTGLVTFALTVLFFWTALYSAYQIYPFGGQVRRILTLMTDHRDSGKIVLTPIYLIIWLILVLRRPPVLLESQRWDLVTQRPV